MCVLWVASPPPLFLKFLEDFYVEGAGSFFCFNKGQKWNEAEQARCKLGIQKDSCAGELLDFEKVNGFEILLLLNSRLSNLGYVLFLWKQWVR